MQPNRGEPTKIGPIFSKKKDLKKVIKLSVSQEIALNTRGCFPKFATGLNVCFLIEVHQHFLQH